MSPIDSPTEATRIYATNRFDFGREAGRVAGRRSRALVKALSSLAKRDVRASAIAAQASRQSLFAAQSELNEEIRGLAQALNMDATDLAATSALACSILVPGCTNFAAAPPATSDGQVMTSWNFDVPPYFRVLMGSFPMFVRELEGTIPYLCMGVPALFGIGILNAEGLSSVVNAVGMTDDGPGLSPFELNNIAMETCRSVDEAAAVFRDRPRRIMKAMYMGMLFNWNTIWADTRGGLSVFECSHNHFHQEKAGPDANLASANHHQFLDHSLTGSVDPSQDPLITGSYSRLPRMYALLREFHGSIDPFVAKRIISDHVPDYSELQEYGIEREWWQEKVDDSTICAHAWNLRRHLSKGELELATEEVGMSWTVYSFQVRPQRMTVWFTDGHPCRRLTTPYYWGRLLGAECEPDPGALDPASRSTRPEGARRGLFMEQSAGYGAALEKALMGVTDAVEKQRARKHPPGTPLP